MARRSARVPGWRHDRRGAARARRIRQPGRTDQESERVRLFAEAAARSARRGGGTRAIRKRGDWRACDRARRADVLADHGVWQQRLGGSPGRNDADSGKDRRAAGNAGLPGGRLAGGATGVFAETIETGKPFPVSTADMLDVVGAFEAVIRSMAEERPVSVSRA